MSDLRVALIGVGAMGRNHARLLDAMDGISLVAAADASPGALDYLRRRTGACLYADHQALLAKERIDAAVVAVPTAHHHTVAADVLAAGAHVLVEKPLAATTQEARDLINRAITSGRVLAVGHVERSNPAVIELKRRLGRGDLGRVYEIQARRQSPLPTRVRDVGVTIDLATHDVDLVRFVLDADPVSVYARTARRLHASHEDLLVSVMTFPGGEIATLQVNWLTPTKVRKLSVIGEDGMYVVEHLTQELTHFAYTSDVDGVRDWTALSQLVGRGEGDVTRLRIHRQEPLELELRDFAAACAGASPAASGEDGLRALEIAEAMIASAASESRDAYAPPHPRVSPDSPGP